MARSLHPSFKKSIPLPLHFSSLNTSVQDHYVKQFQVPKTSDVHIPSLRGLCTIMNQVSTNSILLRKLEIALKDHRLDEAWEAYTDFKTLYGIPRNSLMTRLIIQLSYSSDSNWLRKAGDLVISLRDKSDLLRPDLLAKLSLSLSRNQMAVHSSTILRLILEKGTLPPLDILSSIFLHMVKTDVGTCLSSNILIEICECFRESNANRLKPSTILFNLVLDGCVKFQSSFKGQQIINLMAQVCVMADLRTINIIAKIHDLNFQRDELKRFKHHIDQVPNSLVHHYRQFYDSLLNLHLKFDDVDSACGLIHELNSNRSPVIDLHKPCFVAIGSQNLKVGLKLQICPLLLEKDSVLKVEDKHELITCKNGEFTLTNKALSKLIVRYKRQGRVSDLSNLLIKFGKTISDDVIDSCIQLGWLVMAHDILEDFVLNTCPLSARSYELLLSAYRQRNMFREAEALLKQIKRSGIVVKVENSLVETSSYSKSDLSEFLVRETSKLEEREGDFVVNELNSSIYFFMKAKMIDDALKTYRKMHDSKILPNVSTFFTLVYGLSSLEMYREITFLWGDIKRSMDCGNLVVNRDLYEVLVMNFIRGGYFERVMEVIGCMKERSMFVDKLMCKREFLKFHKDLYRSLRASKPKDEVQSKRIEHVRAFRKWVGIHSSG